MALPPYFGYDGRDIARIRKHAEELYSSGRFNCSDGVMAALKEAFFPALPDYVVASASGFPVGIGGSGCARCGSRCRGGGRSSFRPRKIRRTPESRTYPETRPGNP